MAQNTHQTHCITSAACGILRHLRESGRPDIDIFKDTLFADFRATLDGEMKWLQSQVSVPRKRQAEPLKEEEEE